MGSGANFIEVALAPFDRASEGCADREGWLDDCELNRLAQMRQEGDRRRFVTSRVLLRETLARVTGIGPTEWRFCLHQTGQWSLAAATDLPPIHFSTSHCGAAVAVAVSDLCPVGVDIEAVEAAALKFPIDGVLAESEIRELSALPPAQRELATLRLWTVKEALAKLVGLGADIDFSSFDVSLRPLRLVWAGAGIAGGRAIRLTSQERRISGVAYQVALAFRLGHRTSPRVDTRVLEPLSQEG